MKFDSELPRRLTPVIERRAGYAVAKNVPRILADIEQNIRETGESGLTVTVKIRFEAVSRSCLTVKTSVGWVRKTSYIDNDLSDLDIDLQQPELPFERPANVVEWNNVSSIMQRIIAHAEANNLKLIRVANIGDPDCCRVQTYYKNGSWQDHLLETPAEVAAVLQAVAYEGGMAYQGQELLQGDDFEIDPELRTMPVVESLEEREHEEKE